MQFQKGDAFAFNVLPCSNSIHCKSEEEINSALADGLIAWPTQKTSSLDFENFDNPIVPAEWTLDGAAGPLKKGKTLLSSFSVNIHKVETNFDRVQFYGQPDEKYYTEIGDGVSFTVDGSPWREDGQPVLMMG
jgi:hypothetical protein